MISIMSDSLEQLFYAAAVRRIGADAWLFHGGDAVRFMYLVADGSVSLLRATGAGAPVMLQRAGPLQVLAEASAYSPVYHCDARAVTAAVLRVIPVARFRERLAQKPLLGEVWATHLAHAVQGARMRAEIRTLRTVAERLDAWLGEGRSLPEKGKRQDLAAELGVSREALYRELAKRRSKAVEKRLILAMAIELATLVPPQTGLALPMRRLESGETLGRKGAVCTIITSGWQRSMCPS